IATAAMSLALYALSVGYALPAPALPNQWVLHPIFDMLGAAGGQVPEYVLSMPYFAMAVGMVASGSGPKRRKAFKHRIVSREKAERLGLKIKQTVRIVIRFAPRSDKITRILLLRKGKVWEVPGGKVDGDDNDAIEAAVREIEQETGFQMEISESGRMLKPLVQVSKKQCREVVTFHVTLTGDSLPDIEISDEHRKYKWVKEEKLFKRDLKLTTQLALQESGYEKRNGSDVIIHLNWPEYVAAALAASLVLYMFATGQKWDPILSLLPWSNAPPTGETLPYLLPTHSYLLAATLPAASAITRTSDIRQELERVRDMMLAYRPILNKKIGLPFSRRINRWLDKDLSQLSSQAQRSLPGLVAELPTIENPRLDLYTESELSAVFARSPRSMEKLISAMHFKMEGPILALTEGCVLPCAHCRWTAPYDSITMMSFPKALQIITILYEAGFTTIKLYFAGDPCDYYDPYYGATLVDVVRFAQELGIMVEIVTRGPVLNPVFRQMLEDLSRLDRMGCKIELSFHLLQLGTVRRILRRKNEEMKGLLQPQKDRYREIIKLLRDHLAAGQIYTYPTPVRENGDLKFLAGYVPQALRRMFNSPWSCAKCKNGAHRKPLIVDGRKITLQCASKGSIDHVGRAHDLLLQLNSPEADVPYSVSDNPHFVIEPQGALSMCFPHPRAGRLGTFFRHDDFVSDGESDLYFSDFADSVRHQGAAMQIVRRVEALGIFYPAAAKAILEMQSFGTSKELRTLDLERWFRVLKDVPIGVWGNSRSYIGNDGKRQHAREELPVRAFDECRVVLKPGDLRRLKKKGSVAARRAAMRYSGIIRCAVSAAIIATAVMSLVLYALTHMPHAPPVESFDFVSHLSQPFVFLGTVPICFRLTDASIPNESEIEDIPPILQPMERQQVLRGSKLSSREIAQLVEHAQGVMTFYEFLIWLETLPRSEEFLGYSLGREVTLYWVLSKFSGLMTWRKAISKHFEGRYQLSALLQKINSLGKPVIFFVPQNAGEYRNSVTTQEITWLLDHPEHMSNVYFVFGADVAISESDYRRHIEHMNHWELRESLMFWIFSNFRRYLMQLRTSSFLLIFAFLPLAGYFLQQVGIDFNFLQNILTGGQWTLAPPCDSVSYLLPTNPCLLSLPITFLMTAGGFDSSGQRLEEIMGSWQSNFVIKGTPGCLPKDPVSRFLVRALLELKTEPERVRLYRGAAKEERIAAIVNDTGEPRIILRATRDAIQQLSEFPEGINHSLWILLEQHLTAKHIKKLLLAAMPLERLDAVVALCDDYKRRIGEREYSEDLEQRIVKCSYIVFFHGTLETAVQRLQMLEAVFLQEVFGFGEETDSLAELDDQSLIKLMIAGGAVTCKNVAPLTLREMVTLLRHEIRVDLTVPAERLRLLTVCGMLASRKVPLEEVRATAHAFSEEIEHIDLQAPDERWQLLYACESLAMKISAAYCRRIIKMLIREIEIDCSNSKERKRLINTAVRIIRKKVACADVQESIRDQSGDLSTSKGRIRTLRAAVSAAESFRKQALATASSAQEKVVEDQRRRECMSWVLAIAHRRNPGLLIELKELFPEDPVAGAVLEAVVDSPQKNYSELARAVGRTLLEWTRAFDAMITTICENSPLIDELYQEASALFEGEDVISEADCETIWPDIQWVLYDMYRDPQQRERLEHVAALLPAGAAYNGWLHSENILVHMPGIIMQICEGQHIRDMENDTSISRRSIMLSIAAAMRISELAKNVTLYRELKEQAYAARRDNNYRTLGLTRRLLRYVYREPLREFFDLLRADLEHLPSMQHHLKREQLQRHLDGIEMFAQENRSLVTKSTVITEDLLDHPVVFSLVLGIQGYYEAVAPRSPWITVLSEAEKLEESLSQLRGTKSEPVEQSAGYVFVFFMIRAANLAQKYVHDLRHRGLTHDVAYDLVAGQIIPCLQELRVSSEGEMFLEADNLFARMVLNRINTWRRQARSQEKYEIARAAFDTSIPFEEVEARYQNRQRQKGQDRLLTHDFSGDEDLPVEDLHLVQVDFATGEVIVDEDLDTKKRRKAIPQLIAAGLLPAEKAGATDAEKQERSRFILQNFANRMEAAEAREYLGIGESVQERLFLRLSFMQWLQDQGLPKEYMPWKAGQYWCFHPEMINFVLEKEDDIVRLQEVVRIIEAADDFGWQKAAVQRKFRNVLKACEESRARAVFGDDPQAWRLYEPDDLYVTFGSQGVGISLRNVLYIAYESRRKINAYNVWASREEMGACIRPDTSDRQARGRAVNTLQLPCMEVGGVAWGATFPRFPHWMLEQVEMLQQADTNDGKSKGKGLMSRKIWTTKSWRGDYWDADQLLATCKTLFEKQAWNDYALLKALLLWRGQKGTLLEQLVDRLENELPQLSQAYDFGAVPMNVVFILDMLSAAGSAKIIARLESMQLAQAETNPFMYSALGHVIDRIQRRNGGIPFHDIFWPRRVTADPERIDEPTRIQFALILDRQIFEQAEDGQPRVPLLLRIEQLVREDRKACVELDLTKEIQLLGFEYGLYTFTVAIRDNLREDAVTVTYDEKGEVQLASHDTPAHAPTGEEVAVDDIIEDIDALVRSMIKEYLSISTRKDFSRSKFMSEVRSQLTSLVDSPAGVQAFERVLSRERIQRCLQPAPVFEMMLQILLEEFQGERVVSLSSTAQPTVTLAVTRLSAEEKALFKSVTAVVDACDGTNAEESLAAFDDLEPTQATEGIHLTIAKKIFNSARKVVIEKMLIAAEEALLRQDFSAARKVHSMFDAEALEPLWIPAARRRAKRVSLILTAESNLDAESMAVARVALQRLPRGEFTRQALLPFVEAGKKQQDTRQHVRSILSMVLSAWTSAQSLGDRTFNVEAYRKFARTHLRPITRDLEMREVLLDLIENDATVQKVLHKYHALAEVIRVVIGSLIRPRTTKVAPTQELVEAMAGTYRTAREEGQDQDKAFAPHKPQILQWAKNDAYTRALAGIISGPDFFGEAASKERKEFAVKARGVLMPFIAKRRSKGGGGNNLSAIGPVFLALNEGALWDIGLCVALLLIIAIVVYVAWPQSNDAESNHFELASFDPFNFGDLRHLIIHAGMSDVHSILTKPAIEDVMSKVGLGRGKNVEIPNWLSCHDGEIHFPDRGFKQFCETRDYLHHRELKVRSKADVEALHTFILHADELILTGGDYLGCHYDWFAYIVRIRVAYGKRTIFHFPLTALYPPLSPELFPELTKPENEYIASLRGERNIITETIPSSVFYNGTRIPIDPAIDSENPKVIIQYWNTHASLFPVVEEPAKQQVPRWKRWLGLGSILLVALSGYLVQYVGFGAESIVPVVVMGVLGRVDQNVGDVIGLRLPACPAGRRRPYRPTVTEEAVTDRRYRNGPRHPSRYRKPDILPTDILIRWSAFLGLLLAILILPYLLPTSSCLLAFGFTNNSQPHNQSPSPRELCRAFEKKVFVQLKQLLTADLQKRPALIVSGITGSGKTTTALAFQEHLSDQGQHAAVLKTDFFARYKRGDIPMYKRVWIAFLSVLPRIGDECAERFIMRYIFDQKRIAPAVQMLREHAQNPRDLVIPINCPWLQSAQELHVNENSIIIIDGVFSELIFASLSQKICVVTDIDVALAGRNRIHRAQANGVCSIMRYLEARYGGTKLYARYYLRHRDRFGYVLAVGDFSNPSLERIRDEETAAQNASAAHPAAAVGAATSSREIFIFKLSTLQDGKLSMEMQDRSISHALKFAVWNALHHVRAEDSTAFAAWLEGTKGVFRVVNREQNEIVEVEEDDSTIFVNLELLSVGGYPGVKACDARMAKDEVTRLYGQLKVYMNIYCESLITWGIDVLVHEGDRKGAIERLWQRLQVDSAIQTAHAVVVGRSGRISVPKAVARLQAQKTQDKSAPRLDCPGPILVLGYIVAAYLAVWLFTQGGFQTDTDIPSIAALPFNFFLMTQQGSSGKSVSPQVHTILNAAINAYKKTGSQWGADISSFISGVRKQLREVVTSPEGIQALRSALDSKGIRKRLSTSPGLMQRLEQLYRSLEAEIASEARRADEPAERREDSEPAPATGEPTTPIRKPVERQKAPAVPVSEREAVPSTPKTDAAPDDQKPRPTEGSKPSILDNFAAAIKAQGPRNIKDMIGFAAGLTRGETLEFPQEPSVSEEEREEEEAAEEPAAPEQEEGTGEPEDTGEEATPAAEQEEQTQEPPVTKKKKKKAAVKKEPQRSRLGTLRDIFVGPLKKLAQQYVVQRVVPRAVSGIIEPHPQVRCFKIDRHTNGQKFIPVDSKSIFYRDSSNNVVTMVRVPERHFIEAQVKKGQKYRFVSLDFDKSCVGLIGRKKTADGEIIIVAHIDPKYCRLADVVARVAGYAEGKIDIVYLYPEQYGAELHAEVIFPKLLPRLSRTDYIPTFMRRQEVKKDAGLATETSGVLATERGVAVVTTKKDSPMQKIDVVLWSDFKSHGKDTQANFPWMMAIIATAVMSAVLYALSVEHMLEHILSLLPRINAPPATGDMSSCPQIFGSFLPLLTGIFGTVSLTRANNYQEAYCIEEVHPSEYTHVAELADILAGESEALGDEFAAYEFASHALALQDPELSRERVAVWAAYAGEDNLIGLKAIATMSHKVFSQRLGQRGIACNSVVNGSLVVVPQRLLVDVRRSDVGLALFGICVSYMRRNGIRYYFASMRADNDRIRGFFPTAVAVSNLDAQYLGPIQWKKHAFHQHLIDVMPWLATMARSTQAKRILLSVALLFAVGIGAFHQFGAEASSASPFLAMIGLGSIFSAGGQRNAEEDLIESTREQTFRQACELAWAGKVVLLIGIGGTGIRYPSINEFWGHSALAIDLGTERSLKDVVCELILREKEQLDELKVLPMIIIMNRLLRKLSGKVLFIDRPYNLEGGGEGVHEAAKTLRDYNVPLVLIGQPFFAPQSLFNLQRDQLALFMQRRHDLPCEMVMVRPFVVDDYEDVLCSMLSRILHIDRSECTLPRQALEQLYAYTGGFSRLAFDIFTYLIQFFGWSEERFKAMINDSGSLPLHRAMELVYRRERSIFTNNFEPIFRTYFSSSESQWLLEFLQERDYAPISLDEVSQLSRQHYDLLLRLFNVGVLRRRGDALEVNGTFLSLYIEHDLEACIQMLAKAEQFKGIQPEAIQTAGVEVKAVEPPIEVSESGNDWRIDKFIKFFHGRLYNPDFGHCERFIFRDQKTAVFDLEHTIVAPTADGAVLRPGIYAQIKELQSLGYRVVLWTTAKRAKVRTYLTTVEGFEEVAKCFERIYTGENFLGATTSELMIAYREVTEFDFSALKLHSERRHLKDLVLLGYEVLVDDGALDIIEHVAAYRYAPYKIYPIVPFDNPNLVDLEPMEYLAKRIDILARAPFNTELHTLPTIDDARHQEWLFIQYLDQEDLILDEAARLAGVDWVTLDTFMRGDVHELSPETLERIRAKLRYDHELGYRTFIFREMIRTENCFIHAINQRDKRALEKIAGDFIEVPARIKGARLYKQIGPMVVIMARRSRSLKGIYVRKVEGMPGHWHAEYAVAAEDVEKLEDAGYRHLPEMLALGKVGLYDWIGGKQDRKRRLEGKFGPQIRVGALRLYGQVNRHVKGK
ncbi:NUDIX domain-containing protein, partial [Candidatus Omnitrophota bacterium]